MIVIAIIFDQIKIMRWSLLIFSWIWRSLSWVITHYGSYFLWIIVKWLQSTTENQMIWITKKGSFQSLKSVNIYFLPGLMYCIVRVTDMDKIRTEEKTQTLVIFVTLPKSINSIAKICLTGDTIRRIDIVSRCFENINNNCCETKFVKMPFVYYLQIINP